MFALKTMVIVFSVLSILRVLPDNSFTGDKFTEVICCLISALLVTFSIGMALLSIDDIILYPLMALSVILSITGWVVSSIDNLDSKI